MRKWTRRILVTLLIVLACALAITQVVLWTDYPRKLVLNLVQRQLGLRVEAATLSTGWFGSTTLSDVRVSLPLAEESFLSMPAMEIDHTALIPLIVTRKFELDGIELREPDLVVRRDANGRWNLQDVAELLAKVGGGTPEPGTKKRPPKLPRLRLIDGTINVHEHDGRKLVVAPLNVTGDPQGPLVYRYDASAGSPKRLTAVGQVAPGENWKHEVKLYAEPGDWLTPWVPDAPTPLVINADWAGVVDDGRVVGRLVIADAKYEKFGARGRVVVQSGRGGGGAGAGGMVTVLNPQGLVLTTSLPAVPEVQLASGALEIAGPALRAKQIRVSALGGSAQLDGAADVAAKSGELTAVWVELPAPRQVRHSGNLTVRVRTPFPGGPEVKATLVTRGALNEAKWTGEIDVSGAGREWDDMAWVVNARQLGWNAKQSFEVNDFTARLRHLGEQITLTDVKWPGHEVTASGWYHFGTESWSLRMDGHDTAPVAAGGGGGGGGTAFDFDLVAGGAGKRASLENLLLRAQEIELRVTGAYDGGLPRPFDFAFVMNHSPRPPTGPDEPPVRGRLAAEGRISGTQAPLNLEVAGFLRARDLIVLGREYGDINGTLTGAVTQAPERVAAEFHVRDLALFGGQWQVNAAWPYAGADKLTGGAGQPLRARVTASGLELSELGALLRVPLDGGAATGEWVVDVPLPGVRGDTVAMTGSFRAADVVVGGSGGAGGGGTEEAFRADEIAGQMSLKNGVFRADPITLRRADGDVSGTATIAAQTTLADPARPKLVLAARTWPVKVGDAMAAVTADANLTVDAEKKSATGPVTARASFATTQRAIGEAAVDARIDGRVATFDRIVLDAIGGHAEGSGSIDADDPNRSTLTMSWSGIEGARLADMVPQLEGLTGTYAGAVALAPATGQRALEPLRLTVGVTPDDGKFRALEVGPMKLSAYLNLRENFGLERVVLDAAPDEIRAAQRREAEMDRDGVPLVDRPLSWNDIRVADGRIRLWGRRGRHGADDVVQTHVIADFFRLDINQLVHAVKPEAEPMPGRLSGSMTVHGNPKQPDLVLGQGHVEITESDLANIDALALLYNLTRVGQSTSAPIGNGSLDVTLQASTLSLQNIRYFNRGVQARSSSIDISDVWRMPDSPIFGFIVGSVRPLKDLKLPLLADVDQVMNAVQAGGVNTVRVDGTVADPKPRTAALDEVGDAFKRFLIGDVNAEARGRPVAR